MKILRYILLPIVPIYFLVTWVRNKCYDLGIFKSYTFEVPTICVGNLSVGGTGKTPMIEYLIRLLKDDFAIATLSRGYKRTTQGFVIADKTATALTVGDEPYQFYSKFPDVTVSVDADRRRGISKLMARKPAPQLILLDDAFQHRKVRAGLNILLTSYGDLYVQDMPLPTGNLRESKRGADRADVIVVTKCPRSLSDEDKNRILRELRPEAHQTVFFSWIQYPESIKNRMEERTMESLLDTDFTLVTGIANPRPLVAFLKSKALRFEHLNFSDHHSFSAAEISDLKSRRLIVTTEKDYMRLSPHFAAESHVFYLPIVLELDRPEVFEALVKRKLIPMA